MPYVSNMEFKFVFTENFQANLNDLDHKVCAQILKKIKTVATLSDQSIFNHIEPLKKKIVTSTHRLKMGDYRILFQLKDRTFYGMMIGHRREIYRKK